MKKLLLILCVPMLYSCDLINKEKEKKFIWTDSSESLNIVPSSGLSNDDVVVISIAKDDLPPVASDLLKTIRTTTDDLTCIEDGVTYKTTITDESGESEEYYSDNSDCNENDKTFISTEHIEDLVELLI